ncbi:hypothetical protein BD410DRAFT_901454 [Rickenella mellea]|uniref:Uncharacterized protein n=1 Tax=Rickenella mellea TaxID=50990 RepID=A0A4Y7PPX7_9AGAM|nr:hypothetical protein BD410DRAFT_901454 [Rickenella mellea]
MGTCSKAALAWGFEIPSEKLHALLECFRKHAQAEDASNANSQETTDESGEDDSVKGGDQDNTTGEESVLGARTAKEREGGAKKRKVALNSEDAEDLYFSFLDETKTPLDLPSHTKDRLNVTDGEITPMVPVSRLLVQTFLPTE